MKLRTTSALLLAVALAGCGSSSSNKTASTKSNAAGSQASATTAAVSSGAGAFKTHAGLAFGVFYRYIFNPYREGRLRAVPANAAEVETAARAAAFVAAQLRSAAGAAREDASLRAVVTPLEVLDRGFAAALAKFKSGHSALSEIDAANLAISSIKGIAANAGTPITESTPQAL